MKQDPIEKLLHEADTQLSGSADDHGALADRVIRIASRRRRLRATGGVLTLLIAGSIAGLMLTRSTLELPQLAEQTDLQQIQAEIAVLEARVNSMESREKQSQLKARLTAIPFQTPDQNIERAATIIILQADRTYGATADPQPALRAYQEVITNFPQASSADVARQRIARIEKAG